MLVSIKKKKNKKNVNIFLKIEKKKGTVLIFTVIT